ncbi:transglycosylase domain-containing protein [Caulobacter segnis]
MLLAWRLEQVLSKDEILEALSEPHLFGAGTYGIDGAAQTYFDKPAQLTLSEAALLASLPKALRAWP